MEPFRETHDDDVDAKALADEIWRRGLKFADLVDGHYEMLSNDELHALVIALRASGQGESER